MTQNTSPFILVADDEPNICFFIQEMLAEYGFEIVLARDGVQALELLEKHTFDLALLDVNMPKVSGIDVMRTLSERFPETVVILLTAHGTMETAITSLRHNVHDFLLKPCKPAELRKSIQSGLAERQLRILHRDAHQLITLAAHELRNAATGVNLSADLILMSAEADRPRYFQVLKSQTKRLAKIATDILNMVKLREHANQPMESLCINDLLTEIIPSFVAQGKAKGLDVTWQPGLDLPDIQANSHQIQHAITNILANAISYTLEGSVSIKTVFDPQSNRVGCIVQDTGLGIENADLPQLFERFYRGMTVIRERLDGTGLGLSIVKEVMDLHHGEASVESYLNQGSTFTLWFSAKNTNNSATQQPQNANYQSANVTVS